MSKTGSWVANHCKAQGPMRNPFRRLMVDIIIQLFAIDQQPSTIINCH